MLNHLKKFRYDYLVVIALVVVTAGVYGQVIHHAFISFDDPGYVTENDVVRKGLTREGFLWAFTTLRFANWHPLTWLSHMLDVEIFGMKPGLHHLVNVFLHVLNTALLFVVLRQMTGALWRSAFVAALFALHPLHVESVAWVAERKDMLSTLFWMLTLWAYGRYARKPGVPRYWPVLLFFTLGLLAKPMLVTLPLVLLLLDYWPLGRLKWKEAKPAAPATPSPATELRSKKQRRQLREQKKTPPPRDTIQWNLVLPLVYEKMPLLALSAASSLITFYAQQKGGAVASISHHPLTERVANAIVSYAAYLWKMVWPSGLIFFYPLEAPFPAVVLASALLLLAATFVSLRWAESRPYLLVGWLWYLITLLPVIGIIKVGSAAMADRYTYVTLTGPFIVLAWGSFDLSQTLRLPKAALAAASATVVAACMLVTYVQIGHWKDGFSLSRHALKFSSRNHGAHFILADEYIKQKRYEDALPHLKAALDINPRLPEPNMSMGLVQYFAGKYAEAIEHFNLVLSVNPNFYMAYEWLGKAYLATGKIDQALYSFRLAIQPDRDNAATYGGMGEALIVQNRLDEALQYTLLAIEGQPKNEKLYNNAGFILIRQGKFDEAIPRLQEAIRIAPDYARAHNNLGGALLRMKRVDEAIRHFETAIRLEPGNQLAQENLKYALAQKKEVKKSGR